MRSRVSASRRDALRAAREALLGRLPSRYNEGQSEFAARLSEALTSGLRILDAGSGRRPAIPVHGRPAGCYYVGLDLSMSELRQAPQGSYDEMIAGDITQRIERLEGCFDLIVCFQVLEHVKPLDTAFENLRCYLAPGGRLITQLSGAFSIFGLANRLLPNRPAVWMLTNLVGRAPESVFPAHYHCCWNDALERILTSWSIKEVLPVWRGADYFTFLRPLMGFYVGYEEWTRLKGHKNLASHYVVDASR